MNNDQVFTTNIVVNGTEYRLIGLSYDGTWYNVIKTVTGEPAYLNADTVDSAMPDHNEQQTTQE